MIPRIIHYCWFGKNPKSKLIKKCIASWKNQCPDYVIIEWNEDNFKIENAPKYVQQAYGAQKYAFVSDYVRLWALIKYGGFYMDTDVQLVKSLNLISNHEAVAGFETSSSVATSFLGGVKGFILFEEFIAIYKNASFINNAGIMDITTNVVAWTEICSKHGCVFDDRYQVVDGLAVYPMEYFSPFENNTGVLDSTEKTIAIHWFDKTWVSKWMRLRCKITRPIHRLFGNDALAIFKK